MPSSRDAVLRSCLVWLAAAIAMVGLYTHSWRKMVATYVVGVVGIAGIFLPDWDFFNRDFSRWCSPVTADEIAAASSSAAAANRSWFSGIGAYPVRVILYTTVYGFALYRWWKYISS